MPIENHSQPNVHAIRRSVWADRLTEFSDFAFGDLDVFARAGAWRAFFSERIGSSFDDRIVFEIGCADAKFLTRIAQKFPTTAFVGIDWKAKAVFDAAARVAAMSLRNVALLRGRAQDVTRIFARGEVDQIWLFHPEPLDDEKRIKNRLISREFLRDTSTVLRDRRSSICIKTDHRDYYGRILDELPETLDEPTHSTDYWNDRIALTQTEHHLFAGVATDFETRFRQKRKPIYYIECRPSRKLGAGGQ